MAFLEGLPPPAENIKPRFYVSTSKSIIKALINMHSFEIQL
ncbi:flavodoxin family protein, partial [Klebsiella pneumoniae]|nr:flavodoxin family protein [Klebsiella pneumoniae]MBK2739966.1 flavodoxin family protein [Klebsiella pneumoniae]